MTAKVYALQEIQEWIQYSLDSFPGTTPYQSHLPYEVVERIRQLDEIVVEVPIPPASASATGSSVTASEHPTFYHRPTHHPRSASNLVQIKRGAEPPSRFERHHGRERAHGNGRKPAAPSRQATEEWQAMKTHAPVVRSKEGVEKDINEVRIALNKISNKNYQAQLQIIMDIVTKEADNTEAIQKITQFIFDIASTNKFYGEIYADLYRDLVRNSEGESCSAFIDILHDFVASFKGTIQTIQYVDSNVDYDAFCEYTKANEKRRATASFIVMLMLRELLTCDTILDIMVFFQETVAEYIHQDTRTNEVDEITELLFLLATLGKDTLKSSPTWNTSVLPYIHRMCQYKMKECPGLSSRTLFKYKDLGKMIL
jgi:hypothetical protein